ncbi:cell division protein FtsI [endosymbiont of Sipalinus gigas]|uniref:penicillin-binding transpeptidase domain-containing protein n=1 Tax=endosymbiont of Sipalinus gigas TaxID=1972134 RepID=UPI000DC6ED18|nr:penicillin-binding transpeptidase domain-containing protein [endosymbiont of Sipalinus gigas]BBA85172.1 cell division protein FtsI [endosymbiont of Sipalinus gigas]
MNEDNKIIILLIIIVNLIIIISRITFLQIFNNKFLNNKGNSISYRKYEKILPRGIIYDRNNKVLAVSVLTKSIYINSYLLNKNIKTDALKKKIFKLSNLLSLNFNKLIRIINKNSNKKFLCLLKNVNNDKLIQSIIKLNIKELYIKNEYIRYYPYKEFTSNIVGLTDIDNIGIEGIEKKFNNILNNYNKNFFHKDKFGNIIEYKNKYNNFINKDIVLSIDEKIQSFAFNKMHEYILSNKSKYGIIILTNIKTGEILAMVNYPSFDPNNRKFNTNFVRNRSITDLFEPGSIIKPLVLLTALKYGINENIKIDTTPYNVNGYEIKDSFKSNELSMSNILSKSSNTGISRIALSIPFKLIVDCYKNFGVGQLTNIELIGENKGFLPKKRNFSKIEKIILSYGYGLMLTPIQISKIYSIIGNFGNYKPITILKRNNNNIKEKPIFEKKIVKKIINMMEKTTYKGGSATRALIEGYKIAVKTGTVKKIVNKKYVNKYISYIAGIAPIDDPKFSLLVMLDDPGFKEYYGGLVAAPIFKEIMKEALRLNI